MLPPALFLVSAALARPTEGNTDFSFSDEDVVTSYDSPSGAVRVWYSTSGPNVVRPNDDDGDGLPDFVTTVATESEAVLEFYVAEGFTPVVSDGTKGGSDAMDVYLVDFGGSADGHYTAESCSGSPSVCSGYFEMENDFAGYGYSSIPAAIKVLTSHELFHAVQAAYSASSDAWFAEGTAVWAEWAYEPGSEDFLWLAGQMLEDTGRSLDEPPAGPVPVWDYATSLWWWFLANRYGDDIIVDLVAATADRGDLLQSMSDIEAARGGSLQADWVDFANWNVATGGQAGAMESYPFAGDIGPPPATAEGAQILDDNRYYPLAASYYRYSHSGGPIYFALEADAPELSFALHPTDAEGRVLDAIDTWAGAAAVRSLGDQPAGDYWLVGTNATLADQSTKVLTCLGDDATAAECGVVDTGTPDTGGETGEGEDTGESPKGGCACSTDGSMSGLGWGLALAAAALGRRQGSRWPATDPRGPATGGSQGRAAGA